MFASASPGGHTRTFTYDAAGNTTYDNRSGGGYGYTYDALGRMASFAINGVVQAEYVYNAQGQQVVRRLTQAQQTIHNVFDLDGNRIAEYLYDEVGGTSTLIREYIWLNGLGVGVWEGGQLFYVRSDHIGRPVFATNDLGFKVWEGEARLGGRPVDGPQRRTICPSAVSTPSPARAQRG